MTLGWLSSLCTRMQGEVRLLAVANEADSTQTELPAKPHQYLGHSWRYCRARGPELLALAGQSKRSSTHHFGLLTFLSCLWDPVADKLLKDQDWAQPAEPGEGRTLAPCFLAPSQPLGSEGSKQPLAGIARNLPPAFNPTVEWSIGK